MGPECSSASLLAKQLHRHRPGTYAAILNGPVLVQARFLKSNSVLADREKFENHRALPCETVPVLLGNINLWNMSPGKLLITLSRFSSILV